MPSASLQFSLMAPSTANAGSTLTYTIGLSNNGPDDAQNVSLTDLLPSGTTFVSQSQASGPAFTLSEAGGQVSDAIATLPALTSVSLTVVVSVPATTPNNTLLPDSASVLTTTQLSSSSTTMASASTTVQNGGQGQADLAVTASGPATALAGDEIGYTITVTNNGPSDAQAVTLDVPLQDGLIFLDQSQTSGATFTLDEGNNEVLDSLATLPAGTAATFSMTAQVDVAVAGDTALATTATVSGSTTDPNSATTTLTVNPDPPTVSAGPSQTVHAGDTVTFDGSVTDPEGPSNIATIQWDFNYDGSTFNPGAASTLTPVYTFTAAGTYTVALQVTDAQGNSGLGTLTVTVNSSSSALVVDAGADQFVNDGDTASFAGSYSLPPQAVAPVAVDWDFNYDGSNFIADSSASGSLTPSDQFTTPGTYLVALRVTTADGEVGIGTAYVSVANPTLDVVAGSDVTANAGDTVTFQGSATDSAGSADIASIQWDFDYDGTTFNADPSAAGTLTPTHQYTAGGTYEVALQVTDAEGDSALDTLTVTVNPGTIAVSAGAAQSCQQGDTVSFNGSYTLPTGAQDPVSVDWDLNYDGSNFVADPAGSGTLTPTYQFMIPGTYTVALQVTDGNGDSGLSTLSVVVADVAPTANAGPAQTVNVNDTVYFQGSASDPGGPGAIASIQWDFNYDGTFSADPSAAGTYTPTDVYTTAGTYTVALEVTDDWGATGLATTTVTVLPAGQTVVANSGTGTVLVNGSAVEADQYIVFAGEVSVAVVLESSGADYDLQTNSSFTSVGGAVTGVTLTVDTTQVNLSGLSPATGSLSAPSPLSFFGPGDVGAVDLPGGGSTLALYSRGDLGSIVGPSTSGTSASSGAAATDLYFGNLTGSITGLDQISALVASGLLEGPVTVNSGIESLTAYGVDSTVTADANYDVSDPEETASVGAGGVSGIMNMGNQGDFTSLGSVNEDNAQLLEGPIDVTGDVNLVWFEEAEAPAEINVKGDLNQAIKAGAAGSTLTNIAVTGDVTKLQAQGPLTVQQNIAVGGDVTNLQVADDLTVTGKVTANSIATIDVGDNLTAKSIYATRSVQTIKVGKNATVTNIGAGTLALDGSIDTIDVGGNLSSSVFVVGTVGTITVGGNFTYSGPPPTIPTGFEFLVYASEAIGKITATSGDIGGPTAPGTPAFGVISGKSIGTITATAGNIVAQKIVATAGNIGTIQAPKGNIASSITDQGGNILNVTASVILGNITAKWASLGSGGNIVSVEATNKFVGNVAIKADNRIGSITSKNDIPNNMTITAQAGGVLDATGEPTGLAALNVNVTNGNFLGQVIFTYGKISFSDAVKFTNGAALLTVKDKTGVAQTWTVNRTAGTQMVVYLKMVVIAVNEAGAFFVGTTQFTDTTGAATKQWQITPPSSPP